MLNINSKIRNVLLRSNKILKYIEPDIDFYYITVEDTENYYTDYFYTKKDLLYYIEKFYKSLNRTHKDLILISRSNRKEIKNMYITIIYNNNFNTTKYKIMPVKNLDMIIKDSEIEDIIINNKYYIQDLNFDFIWGIDYITIKKDFSLIKKLLNHKPRLYPFLLVENIEYNLIKGDVIGGFTLEY
ncbi:hypothetical protein MJ1_0069 [Nanobdella aerobiophila]|uniref:Uncharacterized protein n=1 Tax=Nanobdella aerobiophila TaxID=2586965 RepID=A0A915S9S9_9ARCH|nr:hypothetical protein [Nanobdella aerobiophila]BBL45247.1 hypothetical protein MJ1_0069 [Nanobdella aerobiophila]